MKAALYCRLSEEDRSKRNPEDDSGSIQNQKALLLRYAAERGWEVYQIYSDDDYAGSDRARPAFNRLLADAEARRFDVVLCKTQSRFTRELELVEKYIHGLFPLWGIRFIGVVDNADSADSANKKARQINGLVNEWYLEDLSENIRSVLDSRRRSGLHIGAFALYGYRKDPDHKGRLLVDEEAAAVVREVYWLFSQGWGKSAIARSLNDRGVPNPTAYKRLKGLRYRQPRGNGGGLWTSAAVASMLRNEMYAGVMVQGRYGSVSYKARGTRARPRETWYRVEGALPAVVTREVWEQVQAMLEQRARPFIACGGQAGLFTGKVRCAYCGRALRATGSRGRRYLQCPTRRLAKDACPGAFVSEARLEGMVSGELRRLADAYLDQALLASLLASQEDPRENAERQRLEADCAAWERRLGEFTAALRALYLDRAAGRISEADFFALTEDFSAQRDRLSAALSDAQARLFQPPEAALTPAGPYRPPERLCREAVEILIEHVEVGRRAEGEEGPPIQIYWKF